LQRLIGEDIELSFKPGKGLGRIRLDPMQIEQILMNLAANARDAMPQGGKCTIETSAVYLDEDYVSRKKSVIPTGRYVALTMTDTGTGISPDHLPHIFDPFYTTKPSGKGTGLGLATVYGIVKQNHGFVWAYSEVGLGTVFKVYLPCVRDRMAKTEIALKAAEPLACGTETVLLVEDEPALRRATTEFLQLRGYTVLQANDGQDALSVARTFGSPIQLVVTDVVMPRMSGGQMAKELAGIRPEMNILFVSGYASQTILDHQVVNVDSNFLQKPYTLRQLANKVRAVLDHGTHKNEGRKFETN
jgi:two-component system cell cycle sensor histidine kinase/response regulator CckA